MFVLLSSPQLSNSCNYAVGIITASATNNHNGGGDYHCTRKERWVGGRGVWISLNKRLHDLLFFPLCVTCPPPSCTLFHPFPPFLYFMASSNMYTPSVLFSPSSIPLSPLNLPPPPPTSLFLANLKFVRRLRLLDGWPLIFCELHLAQTSLRPWCILLTAALVAGPRHLS